MDDVETKYLKIKEVSINRKIQRYAITLKRDGEVLGYIKYWPNYSQFCLLPSDNSVWPKESLNDVVEFIKGLRVKKWQ